MSLHDTCEKMIQRPIIHIIKNKPCRCRCNKHCYGCLCLYMMNFTAGKNSGQEKACFDKKIVNLIQAGKACVGTLLVYVIVWLAVVFGINSASNAGRKIVIV